MTDESQAMDTEQIFNLGLLDILPKLEDKEVMSAYDLIIFDLDGTLADMNSDKPYEYVMDWFSQNCSGNMKYAICSNQGGVGLRYWMLKDGWGNPDGLPMVADVEKRIMDLKSHIPVELIVYVCYRYRQQMSKGGGLSPVPPPVQHRAENGSWDAEWRKPRPGMLLRAISDAEVKANRTLMVGDRIEDQQAAVNAGCDFMWAWRFFDRPKPEENQW